MERKTTKNIMKLALPRKNMASLVLKHKWVNSNFRWLKIREANWFSTTVFSLEEVRWLRDSLTETLAHKPKEGKR